MWRIFSVIVVLTLSVAGWLAYEIGTTGSRSEAAEKVDTEVDKAKALLAEKNKHLLDREAELTRREKALVEKEKILSQNVSTYEKVIRELRTRVADLEQVSDKRTESMRQIYEKMESKKASKILDELDVGLAAGILGGMRGERAADILSHMSSEKAKGITERLLGKRQLSTNSKVNEVKTEQKGGEL